MKNGKTLIYTCCNGDYTHFIPLFCCAALKYNDNIDIEIGVDCKNLTDSEEKCLDYLRKRFPDSQILIRYNMFSTSFERSVEYNNMRCWINSVRFISEPIIRNEYTYICDIDLLILMNNFYNYHIDIMNQYRTAYSNWNRDDDNRCITGLHFCKTDIWYPIDLTNLDVNINDEHLLMKIALKKIKINKNIPRRPLCGIHFSKGLNLLTQLKICQKIKNEINSYKETFLLFIESDDYKFISISNIQFINEYIELFRIYYKYQNLN